MTNVAKSSQGSPGEGPSSQKRRHAAGEDPGKRRQIMQGAWKVFIDQGFDAASMNSICKEAGVSKGTLYVYFENKEDLFVALVESKRAAFFQGIFDRLSEAETLRESLLAFATTLARQVTSDDVIHAQRIVISVVERMPELGHRFYDTGSKHFLGCLQDFLRDKTAEGALAVRDPALAAAQLVELSTAGLWRTRLFGRITVPPSEAEIARTAEAAVEMFLAAYGPKAAPNP